MAFSVVQAGTNLYPVNSQGGIGPALTLPSNITLVPTRVPRFARLNGYVVLVNTPTRPLIIGPTGTVYPLTPNPPATAVGLTATGSGVLTGLYLSEQTYLIKDVLGNVITESAFGPLMASSVSTTAQQLISTWPISLESLVTGSRLYRTAQGPTASYFSWFDSPDPVTGTLTTNIPDSGLNPIAAPIRGSAPDLTLICAYQGKLWGVDRSDIDHLRFTEAGTLFAWGALNSLPIGVTGDDAAGITALIPRRNSLGVARKDSIFTVTGTSLSNYTVVGLNGDKGGPGVTSQESVVVFKDRAFFLWKDGVYTWDSDGVNCISDGRVRSWFTSNTYFNRSRFWRAFAVFDQANLRYRLYLCSAGSAVIDRWIEYDLTTGGWFGPHKTDAFSPSCAFQVLGTDQNRYTVVGSKEGYLSQDQAVRNDWNTSPIVIDVLTKSHDIQTPELEKFWGELEVFGAEQPVDLVNSAIVKITPMVGDLGLQGAPPPAQAPFSYDMTLGRHRLGRLGVGKAMALRFQHGVLNEDVELYGYQVPANVVGKR